MAPRLRSARNATLRALDRVSLLAPVYRAYERLRAVRASEHWEHASDLPVPPPRLRVEVAGTPEVEWCLESGRQQAESIRSAAKRNGAPLDRLGRMLDFGCGCGRVLRHWAALDGPEIHGSDYNERLAGWCAAHLLFVTASLNRLEPLAGRRRLEPVHDLPSGAVRARPPRARARAARALSRRGDRREPSAGSRRLQEA